MKKSTTTKKSIFKSAITGQFVTKAYALVHPNTIFKETLSKGKGK